jgi:DNA-binding NarL/FixJ family response regulator
MLGLLEVDPRFQAFNSRVGAAVRVDVCIASLAQNREVCHRAAPGATVRVLSVAQDGCAGSLLEALRDGAWGFITEDAPDGHVIDVVSRLARGECQALELAAGVPDIAERLLGALNSPGIADEAAPASEPSPLSERETEILIGVACGEDTRAIARRLGLATQTVKNHVTGILNKTGARSRAQAAAVAASRGWLPGLG